MTNVHKGRKNKIKKCRIEDQQETKLNDRCKPCYINNIKCKLIYQLKVYKKGWPLYAIYKKSLQI